ncbi:hypothetical protein CLCR_11114 [Cladophialophora carrionii]|uniref:Uncharacterized protein n=1 Tax=Cladophialophora carrionii TaxID=86049 RepID=A0A1C1CXW6_9EURO|nr:hypothetical protein CLCR_11114 [Cladophialophora carrionii]
MAADEGAWDAKFVLSSLTQVLRVVGSTQIDEPARRRPAAGIADFFRRRAKGRQGGIIGDSRDSQQHRSLLCRVG